MSTKISPTDKSTWQAYTDGACRGNPGPSGCGVLLIAPDGKEYRYKKFIGNKTNNQAEYEALLLALSHLVEHQANCVHLRADSELMIRQLKGIYKVKNENIIPLFKEAKRLMTNIAQIEFEHVLREYNKVADRLANEAIDEK